MLSPLPTPRKSHSKSNNQAAATFPPSKLLSPLKFGSIPNHQVTKFPQTPPATPSKSPSPTSCKALFYLWALLPVRVQKRVLTMAVQDEEPRLIETSYDPLDQSGTFRSPTLVPALLHAFSLSRTIALNRYRPYCFGGHFTGTYINWRKDTVFFSDDLKGKPHALFHELRWFGEGDELLAKTRNLAMGQGTFDDYLYDSQNLQWERDSDERYFRDWSRLKAIKIIRGCKTGNPKGNGNLKVIKEDGREERRRTVQELGEERRSWELLLEVRMANSWVKSMDVVWVERDNEEILGRKRNGEIKKRKKRVEKEPAVKAEFVSKSKRKRDIEGKVEEPQQPVKRVKIIVKRQGKED
ncbi:hypothetical protein B7494_g3079 [Chlorociboria aeruginascens]|nr:hypothetical protein B7494_g3079 [Chlorociboria aeruginascens]